MTIRKLYKIGNSYGVVLDRNQIKALSLKGDLKKVKFEVTTDGKNLILTPMRKSKKE